MAGTGFGCGDYVNNGYSEVFTFRYGTAGCGIPEVTPAIVSADGSVHLRWGSVSDASSYTLRYRLEGETQYKTVEVEELEYLLLYQPSGKRYEYSLSARCGLNGSSNFSEWLKFEIPLEDSLASDSTEAYLSDPSLVYEPEVFEQDSTLFSPPEQVEPSIDDLLNTPTKIYLGGEEEGDLPVSLPTNSSSLSEEELKALLKSKKPTCSGITACLNIVAQLSP